MDYLYSPANTIFSLESEGETMATQDMDRPLSHYFINSSHNTYLTGNQGPVNQPHYACKLTAILTLLTHENVQLPKDTKSFAMLHTISS